MSFHPLCANVQGRRIPPPPMFSCGNSLVEGDIELLQAIIINAGQSEADTSTWTFRA